MQWDSLRIALLYGPVWLIIIVTFVIYARIGLYIYYHLKQLRGLGMTTDWSEDINRIAETSATEGYEMRCAPSSQHQGHALRQQIPSEHPVNMRARPLHRVGSDSNVAAWAYARYSFLFFIALLVTWVSCLFQQRISLTRF